MSFCRHSEPVALQRIWKAIDVIRGQRQIANLSRISKVIQREYSYTPKEILHHILKAVKDNMVVETVSVGCKGSKAGMEQEGYWIPEDSKVHWYEQTHDWYCFICHKPGRLLKCKDCVKAFHKECMENSIEETKSCKYCRRKNTALLDVNHTRKSKEIFNKCLRFIAHRAMENFPEISHHPDAEGYMHYNYFIKQHMNLYELEKLCKENKFEVALDFLCYVELIVHNCILLLGENHEYSKSAKSVLETCMHEVKELSLCSNCYFLSSTKPTKDWFSTPCQPPHRVVWAKQKGFEYWPAKVIQVNNDQVDVRFFGGHHERAWVKVDSMRSIVVSPSELQIKITKSWNKANAEMKEYIIQTEKVYGSNYAAQIVSFDYECSSEESSDRGQELSNIELQTKAAKRKANPKDFTTEKQGKIRLKISKSRLKPESITESESNTSGSSAVIGIIQTTHADRKKQILVLGEKAKPNSECARTWQYGTDCIVLIKKYNLKKKYSGLAYPNIQSSRKAHKVESEKNQLSKSFKCNCRKRYQLVLSRYKASVRKMRTVERKHLLISSALYIRRYLKQQFTRAQDLEEEVARLKSENKLLKSRFPENAESAVMDTTILI
ncbi:zinc finger MYND domain-containing protein 11-like [Styela clava]